MAIADEIRRLPNLRPFDPFTVVTNDGTLVTKPALHTASVEHREPAVWPHFHKALTKPFSPYEQPKI